MKRSSWVLVVLLAACSSSPSLLTADNGIPYEVGAPDDDGGGGPDDARDPGLPEDGDTAFAGDPSVDAPSPVDSLAADPANDADASWTDTDDREETDAPALDEASGGDIDADACTPQCGEAECGDDGCGGVCGECTGGKVCTDGACECMERAYRACCDNAVCWFDSCGTRGLWIVDCPKGCEASRCADCTSQCEGKACGEDGCGGECGRCAAGKCEGLAWTTPGACVNGRCMEGGTVQTCDDFQPCTRDTCDARFGCDHKARTDGYVCEAGRCDSLIWSRPRTCLSGLCTEGGGTQACDDANACTDDACGAVAGCLSTPNTKSCDDADPCTATDVCVDGVCVGSGLKTCDDGDACTRDDVCVHGDVQQCEGTAYSCDDGLACTTDACDGQGGCASELQAGFCRIDSACRGEGQPNDENPCLVCATASSTSAWTLATDGSTCATGSCNGLDFTSARTCVSGRCAAGGGVTDCNDGNACTADTCTASGCGNVPRPDGTECLAGSCNGLTWTTPTTCASGACTGGGTAQDCTDETTCTADACGAPGGCSNLLQADNCLIGGVCYRNGASGPDACKVCMVASSTSAWTDAVNGTACGAGKTCMAGVCTACASQCGQGGQCGDNGCGGTCGTCPSLAGYNVSCTAQRFCEYRNTTTSGWKAHDVWIRLPAGSFMMGTPSGEGGHAGSEEPQHTVTFAGPFLVGKYEVTAATYEACRSASPGSCTAPSSDDWTFDWGTNTSANGRSTHPQNGLTWDQGKAACAWLGGRLPSESEWEYAATGPTHRKYPWGASPEPTCANGTAIYDEQGDDARPWGCNSCTSSGCSGTSPVGSRTAGASWCGALDMAGNAWEWIADHWHGSYAGAPSDGSAWVSPASSDRVVRGGSFYNEARRLRAGNRDYLWPAARYGYVGVRCVRASP